MRASNPVARFSSAGLRAPLLALLAAVYAGAVLALPSDRQQPITIESSQAVRDEKRGVTIYSGDVDMRQGTIHIRADKVTIHGQGTRATRIVAVGQPARYQQQPAADDELVKARAQRIEYHVNSELLYLNTDASIEQEGTTLRGDRIHYDMQAEVVRASGEPDQGGRVQMVIPPEDSAAP